MNDFIETLKRLFFQGQITSKKLNSLLIEKKITKEEYKYIVSE